jgi:hypothetical protein
MARHVSEGWPTRWSQGLHTACIVETLRRIEKNNYMDIHSHIMCPYFGRVLRVYLFQGDMYEMLVCVVAMLVVTPV